MSNQAEEAARRAEHLVEPEWLAAHLDDPKVRVIDCATLEAYRRAHIPGAVGLPVHIYVKDPANETSSSPVNYARRLLRERSCAP